MLQFRVSTVRGQGFNVYVRDVFPAAEVEARRDHMLEMGWKPTQIEAELEKMQTERNICEVPYGLELCQDYVWTHSNPGDLIEIGSWRCFVSDWGYA